MVLHTLRHHANKLARIDVFVPPGLYKRCWDAKIDTTCDVNIYRQWADLVSKMGMWPITENVKLYMILSHQKKVAADAISSHIRVWTGLDDITVVNLDPKEDNKSLSRRFLTTLHQLASWLIYLPIKCLLIFRKAMLCLQQSCTACTRKLKAHKWTPYTQSPPQ